MAPFYKLLGSSQTLGTANTVGNAKLVRLLAKVPLTVTHVNAASGGTQGTILMNGNTEFVLNKKPLDTLASSDVSGNCIAVAVSFTN